MSIDEVNSSRPFSSDAAIISIDQIRRRAYDIWDRNHRPDGHEMQFWLMAERELKAEMVKKNENRKAV